MLRPLLPVLQKCSRLCAILADALLIDQPVWKALMIIEKRCIISAHMLYAGSMATTLLFMLAVFQHITHHTTSLKAPFSTEREHFIMTIWGFVYLSVITKLTDVLARHRTERYMETLRSRYVDMCNTTPNSYDVDPLDTPLHGLLFDRSSTIHVASHRRFSTESKSEAYQAIRQSHKSKLVMYILESAQSCHHERFETTEVLSAQKRALLLNPQVNLKDIPLLHRKRFPVFFVAVICCVTGQVRY